MISGNLKGFLKKVNRPLDRISDRLTIKNKKLANLFRLLMFLVAVHLLFVTVGVYRFMNNRPGSIHSSAQCQRASVALNYYKNDMNFFEPRIQRHISGEGITGLEFPIIYYAGAVLYKIFGFNDVFLKIISLLIVVYGLYMFYRLSLQYIKNSFLVVLIVGSAVLSPVLLFYTPNFLPDAPSLGLTLAGWYFFFQYIQSGNYKHLNFFVLLGALAALIKSIAILSFMVVIGLVILDRFGLFKKQQRGMLFENKWKVLLRIFIGFLSVVAWYFYAHYITIKYKNQTFALKPIMVDSWEALAKVWAGIKNYWAYQYYSYESYVLMLSSIIVIILAAKFVNRLLLSITVLYVLGCMAYVYFFTYQFENHDYYIIAILPCVFFLFLTMGDIAYRLISNHVRLLAVLLVFILFFNMKEAIVVCKDNYYTRNLYELDNLSGIDFKPYEDLEPKLREKGIKRTDKTMSAFDNTYCSTLYLMDQLGINIPDDADYRMVDTLLKKYDIRYLVLNDSARFNKLYPNNFADKIIIMHRGLIVYKLK